MIKPVALRGTAFVAATLAALACRDDVTPFLPSDRPVDPSSTLRLTYSPGNDQAPAWSSDGDTVYYTAQHFESQPSSSGVLVRVPRESGEARPLLLNVQDAGSTSAHWLLAPAPHHATQRLAFIEVLATWGPHPCPETFSPSCVPPAAEANVRLPVLREIGLRVRHSDATGPLADDTTLVIELPGVMMFTDSARTAIVHEYPFLQLFTEDGATGFRASWAPDGERLALSNGLSLYTWTVGDDAAQAVPNTEDGVWAAWSPDGEWIAFTRLERADSTGRTCRYRGAFGVLVCIQQRTEYTIGRHALSLVRPDGSDPIDLGEGDAPAWAPDGSWLFFVRENQIWKGAPDGSGAEVIRGTEGGREPAVSPDGRFLAFARRSARGDYDIWITSLER